MEEEEQEEISDGRRGAGAYRQERPGGRECGERGEIVYACVCVCGLISENRKGGGEKRRRARNMTRRRDGEK